MHGECFQRFDNSVFCGVKHAQVGTVNRRSDVILLGPFLIKAPVGKHLEFFETVDYQLKLLAGLDDRNQDALLRQTLAEMDRVEELAPKMVSYWRSGDFDRLTGLSPMPSHLHERLLTRRNQNWLERIQGYIGEPLNTLVVVGALHLAGPDSVVALLRQSGYTVVQH